MEIYETILYSIYIQCEFISRLAAEIVFTNSHTGFPRGEVYQSNSYVYVRPIHCLLLTIWTHISMFGHWKLSGVLEIIRCVLILNGKHCEVVNCYVLLNS